MRSLTDLRFGRAAEAFGISRVSANFSFFTLDFLDGKCYHIGGGDVSDVTDCSTSKPFYFQLPKELYFGLVVQQAQDHGNDCQLCG